MLAQRSQAVQSPRSPHSIHYQQVYTKSPTSPLYQRHSALDHVAELNFEIQSATARLNQEITPQRDFSPPPFNLSTPQKIGKRPSEIKVVSDLEFRQLRSSYWQGLRDKLTPGTVTTPSVAIWGRKKTRLLLYPGDNSSVLNSASTLQGKRSLLTPIGNPKSATLSANLSMLLNDQDLEPLTRTSPSVLTDQDCPSVLNPLRDPLANTNSPTIVSINPNLLGQETFDNDGNLVIYSDLDFEKDYTFVLDPKIDEPIRVDSVSPDDANYQLSLSPSPQPLRSTHSSGRSSPLDVSLPSIGFLLAIADNEPMDSGCAVKSPGTSGGPLSSCNDSPFDSSPTSPFQLTECLAQTPPAQIKRPYYSDTSHEAQPQAKKAKYAPVTPTTPERYSDGNDGEYCESPDVDSEDEYLPVTTMPTPRKTPKKRTRTDPHLGWSPVKPMAHNDEEPQPDRVLEALVDRMPADSLCVKLRQDRFLWDQSTRAKKGFYSCSHCEDRFRTIASFAIHIDEHRIQRAFACSEPRCPWSILGFSKRSELTRHFKCQHAVELNACSLCGKKFGRKDSMKRHCELVHKFKGN